MIKRMLDKITSNYKAKDSNIEKLFTVIGEENQRIEDTFELIERYRAISEAEGKTLDLIGENVLQKRNGEDDETYRRKILAKIRMNLSPGDIETLIEVLEVFMGDSFDEIIEGWSSNDGAVYDGEPACLVVKTKDLGSPIAWDAIDGVIAGGVGAKYFVQEAKRRYLELGTAISVYEAFSHRSGTAFSGQEETNFSKGEIGPAGLIDYTSIGISSNITEEGEIYFTNCSFETLINNYEAFSPRAGSTKTSEEVLV